MSLRLFGSQEEASPVAVGGPVGLDEDVAVAVTGDVTQRVFAATRFRGPVDGIVSGTGRSGLGTAPYEDLIQVTAPVNPGDSGGPLLNARGEVVGVLAATLSGYREFEFDWPFIRRFHENFPGCKQDTFDDYFQPSQAQGIGFAIPVDLALRSARYMAE